jgi:Zn-dependent peptidase ImmA (M78 family)
MMVDKEVQAVLDDVTSTAPVDVAAAAQRLGVKVFAAKLADKVSGVLVRDPKYGTPSGFVIFVDEDEPAVRQRFTAAHELGHFVLHKDSVGHKNEDNYLLRSEGMSSRQEAEANRFAAALLMPFDLIEDAMSKGITTPKELAKHFQVSEIAMSIRLGLPT